jgi:hypothetical protein
MRAPYHLDSAGRVSSGEIADLSNRDRFARIFRTMTLGSQRIDAEQSPAGDRSGMGSDSLRRYLEEDRREKPETGPPDEGGGGGRNGGGERQQMSA